MAPIFSLLCENIYKNIHPEDREKFLGFSSQDKIHEALSKEIHLSAECRIRHADSKYYWSRITICNGKMKGSPYGREYLFLMQDIHESKAKEVQEHAEILHALSNLQIKYDELLVFAALDSTSNEPEKMGERLQKYLKDYNDSHDHPYEIAASFGNIFEPIDASVSSLEKYIEIADEKMYRMKEETDPFKR